jgi:hypothetical protein
MARSLHEKPKTPQEKKKLSYQKDRRNTYGESPHAARKSIPKNKRIQNRISRRAQEQALPSFPAPPDPEIGDRIETEIRRKKPAAWKKSPDRPLGEVVKADWEYRAEKQARAPQQRLIKRKRAEQKPVDPALLQQQLRELGELMEPFLSRFRDALAEASRGRPKPLRKLSAAMRKAKRNIKDNPSAPQSLAEILAELKKKKA